MRLLSNEHFSQTSFGIFHVRAIFVWCCNGWFINLSQNLIFYSSNLIMREIHQRLRAESCGATVKDGEPRFWLHFIAIYTNAYSITWCWSTNEKWFQIRREKKCWSVSSIFWTHCHAMNERKKKRCAHGTLINCTHLPLSHFHFFPARCVCFSPRLDLSNTHIN